MLNYDSLENSLLKAFQDIIPQTFETAMLSMMPQASKDGSNKCKKFGEMISEIAAEPLAQAIAGAIDYYVKNITIYGNLITVGSPTTHTCTINSPSPITNGKVPNTLGIK